MFALSFTTKKFFKLVVVLGILVLCGVTFFSQIVIAQTTPQINYQGKLTDTSGLAVPDGQYNMRFWLVATPSIATTSAVWTESLTGVNRVTVTNGLFSVMLGSTTPLTSVDFNQPLYLAVEIGGSGSPIWDGEMSPRKILGTVPAAFEAARLGGVASSSFLRSDEADTLSATTSSSLLTLIQGGAGAVMRLFGGGNEVFSVLSNGNVGIGTSTPAQSLSVAGNALITGVSTLTSIVANEATTTNLTLNGALRDGANTTGTAGQFLMTTGTSTLWTDTSSFGSAFSNSAGLAALLSDETGTGFAVFNTNPAFAGTATFSALTATSTLTLSGTAANIALGSNYLSGDGDDEGIFVDGSGNVGIGTTTPAAATLLHLSAVGTANMKIESTGNATSGRSLFQMLDAADAGWEFSNNLNLDGNKSFAISNLVNTNRTYNLTILRASGNVGIGTTTPGAKLDITQATNGFALLMGANLSGGARTEGTRKVLRVGMTSYSYQNEEPVGLIFGDADGTQNFLAFGGGNSTMNAATKLGFYTAVGTTTTTGTERLTIIGNGNVGIGTTSPSALLTVAGDMRLTGRFADAASSTGSLGQILSATANGTSWISTSTLGLSAAFANSAALAALLSDETGTGFAVFNTNPAFAGTATFSALTATSTLTLSGTAANIALGSNYLSGDGDDEGIFVNGSGNVGIGTSTPSTRLTVVGGNLTIDNAVASLVFNSTNASDTRSLIRFQALGNTGNNWEVLAAPDGDFNIREDSTGSRLTISSGGNVGIGTTTPETTLSVQSANATAAVFYRGSSLNTAVEFRNTVGSTFAGITTLGNMALGFSNSLGNAPFQITSSGNVGIGTSTPAAMLDISSGNIGLIVGANGASNTRTTATVKQSRIGFTHYLLTEEPVAYLSGNSSSSANLINMGGGTASMNAATEISFWTAATNATLTGTQRMTIDSSGNVGIGTTSPSALLTVAGDMRLTGRFADAASSTGSVGQLLMATATGTLWVSSSTLGFATPFSTSAGLAALLSDETGTGFAVFNTNPAFAGTATFSALTATSTLTLSGTAANIALGSNYLSGDGGDEGIFVDGSGNVGIGTAAPASIFEIASTSPFIRIRSTRNDDAWTVGDLAMGLEFRSDDSTGSGNVGLRGSINMAQEVTNGTNQAMSFYTGLPTVIAERMRISSVGNVSIGTTSTAAGRLSIQSTTTADILNLFETGGQKVFTVLESGNVGIGASAPGSALEISNGTFASYINPRTGTTGTGLAAGTDVASKGHVLNLAGDIITGSSTGGINMALYNGSSWMRALSYRNSASAAAATLLLMPDGGNVGIGTTSPSALLTIAGDMRLTGRFADASSSTGSVGQLLMATATGTQWVSTSTLGFSGASFSNSAALAALLSDETGTGAAVFGTGATLSSTTLSGITYMSGNVGIGTTSPSARLTIAGDMRLTGRFADAASSTGTLGQILSATANGTNWISTSTLGLSAAFANSAALAALLSDETGTGVAVFGTSPTFTTQIIAPLVVGGTAATSSLNLKSTSGVGTSDFIRFIVGNNGATEAMRINTAGLISIGTSTPWAKLAVQNSFGASVPLFDIATTTSAAFATSSLFRINTNGNVGIGTTSPSTKLSVVGDQYVSGQLSVGITEKYGAITVSGGTAFTAIPGYGVASIGLINSTTGWNGSGFMFTNSVTGSAAFSMVYNEDKAFFGSLTGAGSTVYGVWNDTGLSLGVPAGTNTNKLDVNGSVAIGSYAGNTLAPTNGMIVSGSVGIGTSSPSALLTIAGDMRLTGRFADASSSTGSVGQLLMATATGTQWVATSTLGITGGSSFSTSAGLAALLSDETGTGAAVFDTGATLSSTTLSGITYLSGSVGVGTPFPDTLLNENNGQLTVSGAGITRLAINSWVGNAGFVLAENGTAQYSIASYGGGNFTIYDDVNNVDRLFISPTGNVGIGTTNPLSRLTVVGNVGSDNIATFAASTGSTTLALLANGNLELPGQLISAGINWTPRSAAGDNDVWYGVTYGNGLFVAVGATGDRVMTSPDGINWTPRSAAGDDDSWTSITYGNGLFVAVGNGPDRVMTSPDGINWTPRSAAGDNDPWYSVAYGNGLFVAVGNGPDRVMTSPDGINWTPRSAAGDNDVWYGVTYGNGLFVAVGPTGSGDVVMTSPDGINWTPRSAAGDNDVWYGVTYGNGLFVAVGATGDVVMTSPDGITWTARSAAGNDDVWYGVTYGNGLFVAVSFGSDRVMTSGRLLTTAFAANNIYQGGMSIFGNVGIGTSTPSSRLTVVGNVGSDNIATFASSTGSTALALLANGNLELPGQLISAGINWTPRSAAGDNDIWTSVTYGNGLFVAVGYTGDDRVMTSPDGINWTPRSAAENDDSWTSVTYGNGLFVAVSETGDDRVMTSPDGITWTTHSAAENDDSWYSVAYGNGLFVTVSSGGDDRVMTSPDGITWTTHSAAGDDDAWIAVTYGNGLFVAVSFGSDHVMTSPDGITWTTRSAAGEDDLWSAVTYGNGLFVAVGPGDDRVMTSPDGINWTPRSATGNDDAWSGVTYGNGLFVAISDTNDHVMTSPDGITWTPRSATGDDDGWTDVTYGNGLFVAVSYDSDRVMTSGRLLTTAFAANNIYQGGMSIFGNVGFGTTTSESIFALQRTGVTGTSTVGIDQYIGLANVTSGATQFGNRMSLVTTNTATTTIVGSIFRITDSTSYGNTLRGLEVQAQRGTNTLGENTAISGFGRTFGVRGTTEGDAGAVFEPAGIYGETRGTTQGNALRGYSSSITTAALLQLFQDTSSFSGTGLLMNFGNSGGNFGSTSSKFLDLQVGGTSKFVVTASGTVTIGDGTLQAGLQIRKGGLCVDSDGSCTASTTGRISAVQYHTGNSDLAETYFSNENLLSGEIIYLKGGLSVGRANRDSQQAIIGVVSTQPGLTLGADDSSLDPSEEGYPIALSGRVPIRLSNENGPIKKGDQIMLSSLPGVGMKASSTGVVVGVALEDFDDARAYSETFINQFGENLIEPEYEPVAENDPRINDGCYFGGGGAADETPCVPLFATSTDGQAREAEVIAATQAKERALRQLARTSSQSLTLSSGQEVKVGQVVMFVELSYRYLDEEREGMLEALLTAPAEANEGERIFDRVIALANSFINGVLSIFKLEADEVQTDMLCVGSTCVDEATLKALLEGQSVAPADTPEPPTPPASGDDEDNENVGGEGEGSGGEQPVLDEGVDESVSTDDPEDVVSEESLSPPVSEEVTEPESVEADAGSTLPTPQENQTSPG